MNDEWRTTVKTPEQSRIRTSGPILILAFLFIVGSFLTWYLTWFGRGLSDSEVTNYLSDVKHPRHVQHALLQIQERIEKRDPTARQWYPRLLDLASHPETEFRLTVAWVMGFDNQSSEFHQSLLKLLGDPQPIVRRNAALALVRFADSTGRDELLAILTPYGVVATGEGIVESTLHEGSQIGRGALLVRIRGKDQMSVELRSPLPGQIEQVKVQNGAGVSAGETLLTLNSDEESVWEALRALTIIGQPEDLPVVEQYLRKQAASSARVRQQAGLTAEAIQRRAREKE